jgi:hypothetical protein
MTGYITRLNVSPIIIIIIISKAYKLTLENLSSSIKNG